MPHTNSHVRTRSITPTKDQPDRQIFERKSGIHIASRGFDILPE
jgi:hypothetical protein